MITDVNDTFYLFFMNMSRINGFKGYIGLAIKEIHNQSYFNELNCTRKNVSNELILDRYLELEELNQQVDPTSINNQTIVFSNNFWIRTYSAGCYYIDPITSNWLSEGVDILFDTNSTHTHCQSSHLTSFAGGFVVLQN